MKCCATVTARLSRMSAEQFIVAEIDLDLCRQGKDKMFNFAAHRRPEHYKVITERAGVVEPAPRNET